MFKHLQSDTYLSKLQDSEFTEDTRRGGGYEKACEDSTFEDLDLIEINEEAWEKSVLVIYSLMLGVDRINPEFHKSIQKIFSFKQCVGATGGKPNKSLYFIGLEGDDLIYLDPHFV